MGSRCREVNTSARVRRDFSFTLEDGCTLFPETAQAVLKVLRSQQSRLRRAEQCRGCGLPVAERDARIFNRCLHRQWRLFGNDAGQLKRPLPLLPRFDNFLNEPQPQRVGNIFAYVLMMGSCLSAR